MIADALNDRLRVPDMVFAQRQQVQIVRNAIVSTSRRIATENEIGNTVAVAALIADLSSLFQLEQTELRKLEEYAQ